jgi:uncharacterized Zn finger protein
MGDRRKAALGAFKELKKSLPGIQPVFLDGHALAKTPWGKGWCEHFSGMLSYKETFTKGRSFLRHQMLLHLKSRKGDVKAVVYEMSSYNVTIKIKPAEKSKWDRLKGVCHTNPQALADLANGRVSSEVMEAVCHPQFGLFPTISELDCTCGCHYGSRLCRHAATALYGLGSRLDASPSLLFDLRQANPAELIPVWLDPASGPEPSADDLAGTDLGGIFGVEIIEQPEDDFMANQEDSAKSDGQGALGQATKKKRARSPKA